MKLVIDIPDNNYKDIKEYYEKNDIVEATYSYIYHGIPLDEHDEKVIKETVESIWGKPPYTEVLDKIKAEIIWYRDNRLSYEANSEMIELTNYYLNIIDKYRKEQE